MKIKKFFFVVAIMLSAHLFAEDSSVQFDQFNLIARFQGEVLGKGIEYCDEKGFKYFKIKAVSFDNGLGGQFLLQCDNIPEGGHTYAGEVEQCKFELVCYKEKPVDKYVLDVKKYQVLFTLFAQQNQEESDSTPISLDSSVSEVTAMEELETIIEKSSNLVFVECYSKNCPPCKMLSPHYDSWSKEHSDKGIFLKASIDNFPELAQTFNILSLPTLLIFDQEGDLLERKTGLPDIAMYFEEMNK